MKRISRNIPSEASGGCFHPFEAFFIHEEEPSGLGKISKKISMLSPFASNIAARLGEGFFIKSFGCGKTAKDLEAPGALGEHSPEIFDPSSFAGSDRSVFTNTAKGNAGSGTPNPFPAMPGEGEWPGGRRDSFSGGAKDRFYLIEYGPFGKKINPR